MLLLMTSAIIPEGFKDDVTTQVATEHKFMNMIIDNFIGNGFNLIKTPLIEFLDQDTDDNAFKIVNKKNEKKLNIRDDITLQVARLSETRLSKKNRPLKLCYYGEVVRKKGSMLRPERQFLQIGAECIGESNFLADVEMIELAYNSLNLVGIKNITIEISSRIFYDKFMSSVEKFKKNEVARLIKLKDLNGLLNILDKDTHEIIKNLFNCTGLYKDKKNELKKLSIDKKTSNEINNIHNIVESSLNNKKNINFFLDLCEIDDKNYHSGARFTFFAQDIRGEIARGGRYFVKNSKKQNVATGFTCYMDTILKASSATVAYKRILIPFKISQNKITELRKKGFSLFRHTGSLNISKKIAKEQNCQFYLQKNSVKKV